MNINKLIDDYGHFGPFFGDGFTNHVPMVQYALYEMKQSEEKIIQVSDHLVEKWQLAPATGHVEVINMEDALGNRAAYNGYVKYFKNQLETNSIEAVVKETLSRLKEGLSSMLFHGIIRLSYAVEHGDLNEISRSLAFFACGYERIEFKGRPIPITILKAEFTRFISERDGYFYLRGDIEEKERAIVDSLSELYMNTGSFIVLHTITGFQALVSLRNYFEDFNHILDLFTVCVERVLLRISQSDYKLIKVDVMRSYEELYDITKELKDAHTIKLIYSCSRLDELYHNEKLLTVANIRLNEEL